MHDHERHMVLLAVRAVALAAHLVIAAELAVIRAEDNDGVLVRTDLLERVEHGDGLPVAVADAVVMIVAYATPAPVLVRPRASRRSSISWSICCPFGVRAR